MTISIAPESSENLVDVLKLKEQFAQDPSAYAKLERTLLQIDDCTLAERFRAVFTLKSLGSHQAIDILAKGLIGEHCAMDRFDIKNLLLDRLR